MGALPTSPASSWTQSTRQTSSGVACAVNWTHFSSSNEEDIYVEGKTTKRTPPGGQHPLVTLRELSDASLSSNSLTPKPDYLGYRLRQLRPLDRVNLARKFVRFECSTPP